MVGSLWILSIFTGKEVRLGQVKHIDSFISGWILYAKSRQLKGPSVYWESLTHICSSSFLPWTTPDWQFPPLLLPHPTPQSVEFFVFHCSLFGWTDPCTPASLLWSPRLLSCSCSGQGSPWILACWKVLRNSCFSSNKHSKVRIYCTIQVKYYSNKQGNNFLCIN